MPTRPFHLSRTERHCSHATRLQRGAAALVLMMLLGVSIGLLVIGYARGIGGNDAADPRTIQALSKAREALLGYATTYRDTHPDEVFGYLPCPDMGTGSEGHAAPGCGGTDVTVIGRLPWRTLDLPPLRDAHGECLWYAVSGNFKNNPKTRDLLNRDTNGLIEVMGPDGTSFVAGSTPQRRAVAVIFAAGPVLPGQDRTLAATNSPTICRGNYLPTNYLDTDVASSINNGLPSFTANGLSRFIAAEHSDVTSASNDAFNDRLTTIQPTEVFERHIERRSDFEAYLTDPLIGLLRRSADCLLAYGRSNDQNGGTIEVDRKYLPWAAPLGLTGFGLPVNYADAENTLSGRLPYTAFNAAGSSYATHNNSSYQASPLLSAPLCPGWSQTDEFWNQWKDHLFYAFARGHSVPHHHGHDNDPCSVSECIDVENPAPDGIETNFAGVVIFAGAKFAGQSRNNNVNPDYGSADKNDPANYLEGVNVTSIQTSPTSDSSANRLFSKRASNDSIMCLQTLPVGSTSELFVDPTCGASTRCVADGTSLAAYRAGASNNCRIGTSGIDATCESLAQRISINNCPGSGSSTYSCKRAANDFLSSECLQGITSTKCTDAHLALTTCQ